MMVSQAKIFIVGAAVGAVFGAIVLAPIAYILLIVVGVAGTGAVLHRARRRVAGRSGREHRQLQS